LDKVLHLNIGLLQEAGSDAQHHMQRACFHAHPAEPIEKKKM
jgi:hypothetical protein